MTRKRDICPNSLEQAVRASRKPMPNPEEIERIISEEESNSSVKELFNGWLEHNSLPPEAVLRALIEEARYSEQKRFRKC